MRTGVLGAVALAACGEVDHLHLPPLVGAEIRAQLLIVRTAHPERTLVFARSMEDPTFVFDLPAGLTPSPDHRIYALSYTASLAELGFTSGSQLVHEGTGGPRELPKPSMVHASDLSAPPSGWARLDGVPVELVGLRLVDQRDSSQLCRRFATEPVTLGPRDQLHGVVRGVPYDAERALLLMSQGYMAVIGPSELTLVPPLTGAAGRADEVLARDDGEIYALTAGGRLARGRPGAPFEVIADLPNTSTPTQDVEWTAGGSRNGALEIFATASPGIFTRYTPEGWSVLDDRADVGFDRGPTVFVRPGEGFVAGLRREAVTGYRDGVRSDEPIVVGSDDEIRAAYATEEAGRMVLTARGSVIWDRGDGFRSLSERPDIIGSSIIPYDGGLLVGGHHGLLARYHPFIGWCEPQPLGSGEIVDLIPLADGILAATDEDGLQLDPKVIWLR